MSGIEFSRDEKEAISGTLRAYLREELDAELGQFDAEFLFDFITTKLGPYYYNKGLNDALAAFETRMEDLKELVYELEQPL